MVSVGLVIDVQARELISGCAAPRLREGLDWVILQIGVELVLGSGSEGSVREVPFGTRL